MKKSFYRVITILIISIICVLLIPLPQKIIIDTPTQDNDIINQTGSKNNLTGNYDFVSELGQLAFNYDTRSFLITESQPQEGSMILLTLSDKSGQEIGRIGVFHNGGYSNIPRDGFWADEAESLIHIQNMDTFCNGVPPGIRDSCTKTKNSNNIFYASVDGVYRTGLDQTEYPKKQRYLQNTLSDFPGILFTTEEVGLQYTGLLQDIIDSVMFFETEIGTTKTYYGEGITFEYPIEGKPIIQGSDVIVYPKEENQEENYWALRIEDNVNFDCKTLFNHRQIYNNFSEITEPYHITKASAIFKNGNEDYIWCIDTQENKSKVISSNSPIENIVSNLKLTE